MNWLSVAHCVAGFIVLAEALNKLERADLFDGKCGLVPRLGGLAWLVRPWGWKRSRVVMVLKALGWASLSVGAADALMGPLLGLDKPTLPDVAVIAGFALLIVRSRLKEG
jgi:hypothetical protein